MANDDALRSWHFLQLRRSIEALASDASEQLLLFPGDTTSVSHLAFTFEHWADMMRTHYDAELSATQHDALRMIAGQLALMSRDGTEFDPVLWTDEARRAPSSRCWRSVHRRGTPGGPSTPRLSSVSTASTSPGASSPASTSRM